MLNLTEIEQQALDAPINLSDGHARQLPTPAQSTLVARLPQWFAEVRDAPFEELERRAQTAFLSALGQNRAPVATGQVLSVYSSSVATMAVGRLLQRRSGRVALIHPTFDSIADLLRGHVDLVPVAEQVLAEGDWERAVPADVTCLYLTVPNNPTGWRLDEAALTDLARWSTERDVLLCVDTSFRGFDQRTQYDMYRVLEAAGTDYILLEDTGKLWPMLELKLGFLAVSPRMERPIKKIMSEVLLSVSPLVLRLVEELSKDYAAGGMAQLHDLIGTNRRVVAETVTDLDGVTLLDPDSRVSVCRLRLPSADRSLSARRALKERGVHVLPAGQFYWADPSGGTDQVRIALARDPHVLAEALNRMSDVWAGQRQRQRMHVLD
ncbi:aminotransferase class I/II-fold pyridoxal phosphate-dependent enzyme [Streptomyces aureocirculatus]|uniref:aminotransferase class I/II-fold pyridoxal phosphate-dependent enzyme n=1 Tax=Streptomyces aureocirculatus TaxID=67275 RepID=UPI0004CAF6BB|nr:aminotransferase class I/II-fold pyridoxal phosphate-dependent enzyme [Streptomyces aureocirculatus]